MTDSNEGPLAALLRLTGDTRPLDPIPTVKRIDVMPVEVRLAEPTSAMMARCTPIGRGTARDDECTGCRIFEREAGTKFCPRCNRRAELRGQNIQRETERIDSITRESTARRLDAIDPDWHQKFLSTDAAARFYREELMAASLGAKS